MSPGEMIESLFTAISFIRDGYSETTYIDHRESLLLAQSAILQVIEELNKKAPSDELGKKGVKV